MVTSAKCHCAHVRKHATTSATCARAVLVQARPVWSSKYSALAFTSTHSDDLDYIACICVPAARHCGQRIEAAPLTPNRARPPTGQLGSEIQFREENVQSRTTRSMWVSTYATEFPSPQALAGLRYVQKNASLHTKRTHGLHRDVCLRTLLKGSPGHALGFKDPSKIDEM